MFDDPVVHHGRSVCPLYRGVLCEMITVVDSEKAPFIARRPCTHALSECYRRFHGTQRIYNLDREQQVHIYQIPSEGKQSVTLTPVHKIWHRYDIHTPLGLI